MVIMVLMELHALHCTALHCTALHCTAPHCTALHCTALYCNVYLYSSVVASSNGYNVNNVPNITTTMLKENHFPN